MPESIKNAKQKLLSDLKAIGIETLEAERETELIIAEITELSLSQQILQESSLLNEKQIQRISEITRQRQERIPLQYCLGHAYFMGLKLSIKPGVFIPRADTETVITQAVSLLPENVSLNIAEIGIGSGAISIALLKHFAKIQVTAIDLSPEAIHLSRQNATDNGVIDRLKLVLGSWDENLPDSLDAIVSNPPYIPTNKLDSLAPEVSRFEPHLALFGGDTDGLSFYRSFAAKAPQHLKEHGLAILEFGDGQDVQLMELFQKAGWQHVQIHKDLNRLARVLTAKRPIKSA